MRQRAVAAWLPRAVPTPWLKAAVGPRQPASLASPASRPPRARRRCPDRLARHTAVLTERRSEAVLPRPPRAARLSPSRRAAVSAPLSHRSPPSPVRQRRATAGTAPALCIWAECGFGPEALKLIFIFFLIYSIHCKFKNLCRIHLNSENYETNLLEKFKSVLYYKNITKIIHVPNFSC
jgi:hypothetical protein